MKKIDKWCIKPASEDEGAVVCDYINSLKIPLNFYNSTASTQYYWHFPAYDDQQNFCWNLPKGGYRVIKFAEFEEIVFNKNGNYSYLTKLLKKYGIR
jgi:hypothetical protein